jgi:hypothetical protein
MAIMGGLAFCVVQGRKHLTMYDTRKQRSVVAISPESLTKNGRVNFSGGFIQTIAENASHCSVLFLTIAENASHCSVLFLTIAENSSHCSVRNPRRQG